MKKEILTFSQLIKVFGKKEMAELCRRKEAEATENFMELKGRINQLYKRRAESPDNETFIYDISIEDMEKELYRIKGKIRHWQYKKNQSMGEPTNKNFVDKEELKQIPITRVLECLGFKEAGKSGNRSYYKIRNEKTASCVIYPETNTFFDFGSSVGGDNITLIQYLEGLSFGDACKKLKDMI